jgi:hypothetical protein
VGRIRQRRFQGHPCRERGVEIVSEASRHLPPELKARHPEIPWQKVAGIGNPGATVRRFVEYERYRDQATRRVLQERLELAGLPE